MPLSFPSPPTGPSPASRAPAVLPPSRRSAFSPGRLRLEIRDVLTRTWIIHQIPQNRLSSRSLPKWRLPSRHPTPSWITSPPGPEGRCRRPHPPGPRRPQAAGELNEPFLPSREGLTAPVCWNVPRRPPSCRGFGQTPSTPSRHFRISARPWASPLLGINPAGFAAIVFAVCLPLPAGIAGAFPRKFRPQPPPLSSPLPPVAAPALPRFPAPRGLAPPPSRFARLGFPNMCPLIFSFAPPPAKPGRPLARIAAAPFPLLRILPPHAPSLSLPRLQVVVRILSRPGLPLSAPAFQEGKTRPEGCGVVTAGVTVRVPAVAAMGFTETRGVSSGVRFRATRPG